MYRLYLDGNLIASYDTIDEAKGVYRNFRYGGAKDIYVMNVKNFRIICNTKGARKHLFEVSGAKYMNVYNEPEVEEVKKEEVMEEVKKEEVKKETGIETIGGSYELYVDGIWETSINRYGIAEYWYRYYREKHKDVFLYHTTSKTVLFNTKAARKHLYTVKGDFLEMKFTERSRFEQYIRDLHDERPNILLKISEKGKAREIYLEQLMYEISGGDPAHAGVKTPDERVTVSWCKTIVDYIELAELGYKLDTDVYIDGFDFPMYSVKPYEVIIKVKSGEEKKMAYTNDLLSALKLIARNVGELRKLMYEGKVIARSNRHAFGVGAVYWGEEDVYMKFEDSKLGDFYLDVYESLQYWKPRAEYVG